MTQLFLIPQQFNAQGQLVPKYLATDLLNKSWVAMPYGLELLALVATDPNPALAAEADVFAFPLNLDTLLASADVTSVQSFFAAQNIPNGYVVAGMTWRTVARTTAKVFQINQRHNGLTGTAIFSTNTTAYLAAVAAATVSATVIPPQPVRVGIAPTLPGSLSTLPTVKSNLTATAGSFGFAAPDPNGTLETALTFLGNQFQAPLVMDRGDGFSL
jgi:hypothetical protein